MGKEVKQYLPPLLKKYIHDEGPLMLKNIIYNRGSKSNNYEDSLDIVYKVIDTNESKVVTIPKPKVYVAFTKEQYRNHSYPKTFEHMENCDLKLVRYHNIKKIIMDDAGERFKPLQQYVRESGQFYALNNVHKYPYVYMSDLPIEVHYRVYWTLEFGNDVVKPLNKAYADIETNVRYTNGFPKPGDGEVLCVTVVDDRTKTSHTLYYRMPDNLEQVKAFEEGIQTFKRRCNELFDESYGQLDYKFYPFDDELEMLRALFKLKKMLNPDFLMYWNMDFDINFLVARIIKLGGDPYKIICEEGFGAKSCYYYKDKNAFKAELKGDNFTANTKISYIDQMIIHAALRKSMSTLRTNKLNDTAKAIIGDAKLDYSTETNIAMFPYQNFTKYILYNIKDVLLQKGIEDRVNDLENLYSKTEANAISYAKAFKQTKFLEARQFLEYLYQGLYVGNNQNLNYGIGEENDSRNEVRFEGALVGNPELNAKNGFMIFGVASRYIRLFIIDMDFSAMYPNIINSHNIAHHTMIGKIYIDENPGDLVSKIQKAISKGKEIKDELLEEELEEDDDGNIKVDVDDRGGEFVDDYTTGDVISTATKWFNLPTTDALITRLESMKGEY